MFKFHTRRLLVLASGMALAAGAALAQDGASCNPNQTADLAIRYVGAPLRPAIEAIVDGKPATMALHLLGDHTALSLDAALRRGLPILDYRADTSDGLWPMSMFLTKVNSLAVGPLRIAGKSIVPLGYSNEPVDSYDGYAGSPLLLASDLELDLRARRMKLFEPRGCERTPLTDWPEPTVAIPFSRPADRGDSPRIHVTIDGVKMEAVIDTASPESYLDPNVARSAGLAVGASGKLAIKRLAIGEEVVQDVELPLLPVMVRGAERAALYLGADFLRAHRVRFAMGQQHLYLAYLGGVMFESTDKGADWELLEAVNGNPDAQFNFYRKYILRSAKADQDQARMWLGKATAAGHPGALIYLGRRLETEGNYADAVVNLRKGMDRVPTYLPGALRLYVARVGNGEADLGRRELQASLDTLKGKVKRWPEPVVRYMLGRITLEAMLAEADGDKTVYRPECDSLDYATRLSVAKKDLQLADKLKPMWDARCALPTTKP